MRFDVRCLASAAAATVLMSGMAMGSTISKNTPGAIRHPINEAAKAVGVDHPSHHRYVRTTTYSSHSTTTTRTRRHRRHHRRHH